MGSGGGEGRSWLERSRGSPIADALFFLCGGLYFPTPEDDFGDGCSAPLVSESDEAE